MKTAVALLLLSVAIASTHHFAMEDSNSEESFGCACPRINDLVCGSNGVTYGNSCELKCQQQVHPGLTEASKGECQEKAVCTCPRMLRPVCGTDGQTYSNKCLLDCQTKKNPDVKVSYNGNCREHSRPQVDPMPQPQVDPMPQNDAQQKPAVCACPRILRPVCGTDGQTYSNKCLLDCQTKKNPDVKLSYNGNCRALSQPQEDPMPQSRIDPMFQPQGDPVAQPQEDSVPQSPIDSMPQPQVDPMPQPQTDPMPIRLFVCRCPKILRPVCGTDGVTYSNPCLLNCQAKKNPDLKTSYDGPCEDKPNQFPEGNECICPMNFAPVCGSDGQTYSNKCLLQCENTKDRNLRYEYNGPCQPMVSSSPDVMH